MSRKRKHIEEDVEPTEKIISDGDLLIKSLLEKQLCKVTSLHDELKCNKEFVSRAEYVPVSNFVSGMNSLSSFEEESRYHQNLEDLSAAGLSREDVDFYIDSNKGMDHLRLKHKNLTEDVIKHKLEHIKASIDKFSTEPLRTDKSESKLGRQQTEFMLSIKPNSIETSLLKFALNNKINTKINTISPMEMIGNIEEELMNSFGNESGVNISKIRKKARSLNKRISSMKYELEEPMKNSSFTNVILNENSKWDNKNEDIQFRPIIENTAKVYGCEIKAEKKLFTIRDGSIIPLNCTTNRLMERESKKLTLEEIKAVPKFVDYTPGDPSKVLFLKNLPSVSESDVKDLFKLFESEIRSLRIMSGRMKGQAFIEMSNVEMAEKALHEINGTILKNKPIIIQFGKKKENGDT